eukprot:CAMPEP_0168614270 /NCGR_PEP_ID=MMETSP0449_2-20121227/3886_1 /TAXON_ID=1082188 /ORGANISM="Strombidium rassoulzadegani, Strain ras09" /LENGTH=72 /DNA_ID=CAMNT_0008654941 /DNA_START=134 /DNA_END=352 /DNA_ORIENTATION=-
MTVTRVLLIDKEVASITEEGDAGDYVLLGLLLLSALVNEVVEIAVEPDGLVQLQAPPLLLIKVVELAGLGLE